MSNFAGFVASYAINSLWLVPLIGGAGWVASRLLKRIGAGAQHVTWVAALMLAVVAPGLPLRRILALIALPGVADGHASIAIAAARGDVSGLNGFATVPVAVVFAVFLLYVGVLLYFAARLGWSMYSTAVLLREARRLVLTAENEELWRRCRQGFSVGSVRILSSRRIGGPVTMGWSGPVLLVPEGFFRGCLPEDLFAALAHECAHMKRGDFRKNLLYEAASLLIAFHPVTRMLKAQIAQTREMVCDGMAVERLIDPRTYTRSLLRLATMISLAPRASTSHAIGIFDANILEKRIMTIKTTKRKVSVAVRYGLIVTGTVLLVSVAAIGAATAVAIQPDTRTADAAKPYGQVYHIGGEVSAPVLIHSVQPEFPKSARKSKDKLEGTTLIEMVVDESGAPRDVHVVRSLRPDFDAEAVQAVEQYRFKPAMKLGEPVAVLVKIEVHFARF